MDKDNSTNAHCDIKTEELTSDEIVKLLIAGKLTMQTIKAVNMISAETYKIINEIEKQRFEEPYQYSEFIDYTDYINPSSIVIFQVHYL